MSLKEEKGCGSPQEKTLKNIFRSLVAMYAPILVFDPDESFFPVDLPSTRNASALYEINGDRTNAKNKKLVTKSIKDSDLANADKDHFITVIPEPLWKTEINTISQPPFKMPVPDIQAIHQRYIGIGSDRINAKLTIYGSVCRANKVPNYKGLLDQRTLKDAEVQLALAEEGVIINYYFYFPAMDTVEEKREGDWSGISILLDKIPVQKYLYSAKPVLICYFKKVRNRNRNGPNYLWSGPEGFRKPSGVQMYRFHGEPIESHPLVYISKGRHNCYFENTSDTTTLRTGSPWKQSPEPEKVENGAYSSKKESNTVYGSSDGLWVLGFLFPPFFGFACPAKGRKKYDMFEDVEDVKRPGGHEIKPEKNPSAVTNYPPSGKPGSKPYKFDVEYVDTESDVAMNANWGFAGYWGVAKNDAYPFKRIVGDEKGPIIQENWGVFGGMRRPNLAAWFLWNLYFDAFYGAGGFVTS